MRVLFLNYEYPPLGGGAANATKYILEEYAKIPDLEIDLVTSAVGDALETEKLGKSVTIYKLPIGKDPEKMRHQSYKDLLRYSWEALHFCRVKIQKEKRQYDGVHAFFTIPCGFLALIFRYQFKLPYIVSLRGSDVPGYSVRFKNIYAFLQPIVSFIWSQARRVVSNSEGLKELALKTKPSQDIDVIYNGVDTEFFRPRGEEQISEDKTVTVLCASRLSQRKGFRYVIDAVNRLHEKYPQLQLIIAGGDGDAKEDLHKQVKELGLESAVEFTGQYMHEDLPKLQQRADIFVFPSFNEGMSNSLLEAMAGGLPVVMTPTGGAKELIQEGQNGYLVNFGDSQDIAQKIEKLITNENLRKSMGQKSREAAEQLSWKSVADKYHELYLKEFSHAEE